MKKRFGGGKAVDAMEWVAYNGNNTLIGVRRKHVGSESLPEP